MGSSGSKKDKESDYRESLGDPKSEGEDDEEEEEEEEESEAENTDPVEYLKEAYAHVGFMEMFFNPLTAKDETIQKKIRIHTLRGHYRQVLEKPQLSLAEVHQAMELCEDLGGHVRGLAYYEVAKVLLWAQEVDKHNDTKQYTQEALSLLEDGRMLLLRFLNQYPEESTPAININQDNSVDHKSVDQHNNIAENYNVAIKNDAQDDTDIDDLVRVPTMRKCRSHYGFSRPGTMRRTPSTNKNIKIDNSTNELLDLTPPVIEADLISQESSSSGGNDASPDDPIDKTDSTKENKDEGGTDNDNNIGISIQHSGIDKEQSNKNVQQNSLDRQPSNTLNPLSRFADNTPEEHIRVVSSDDLQLKKQKSIIRHRRGSCASSNGQCSPRNSRPTRKSIVALSLPENAPIGRRPKHFSAASLLSKKDSSVRPTLKAEAQNVVTNEVVVDEEVLLLRKWQMNRVPEMRTYVYESMQKVFELQANVYWKEMRTYLIGSVLKKHFTRLAKKSRIQLIEFIGNKEGAYAISLARHYKALGDFYSEVFEIEDAQAAYKKAVQCESGGLTKGVSFLWKGKIEAATEEYKRQRAVIRIQAMYRARKDRMFVDQLREDKVAMAANPFAALQRRIMPQCRTCGERQGGTYCAGCGDKLTM